MSNRSPVRPRKRRTLLNPGANRGARQNIGALREFNRVSSATELETIYADPVPGRAEETAELARREGVPSRAIEATGAEALEDAEGALQLVNVDGAGILADLLEGAGRRGIPSLGYLMMAGGNGRLAGISVALKAMERGSREDVVTVLRAFGAVTARSGSRTLFGDDARSAHHLAEPLIRRVWAGHTETELARLSAGVEPEHSPIEVTYGGRASLPLLVVRRPSFGEAGDVIEAAARSPVVPLRRGTNFLVAEIADDQSLRLHEARRRLVDGRISVRASTLIDDRGMRAMVEERPAIFELAEREARRPEFRAIESLFGWADERRRSERAIERVRTDTFSVSSPVVTSD